MIFKTFYIIKINAIILTIKKITKRMKLENNVFIIFLKSKKYELNVINKI